MVEYLYEQLQRESMMDLKDTDFWKSFVTWSFGGQKTLPKIMDTCAYRYCLWNSG